ncbi:hypothetical protein PR048_024867 [Dryococelus australis]|uniref:Uncharacterized protein n=1 Tax=Dryococelus australis TaxID=614101 RepID=A0ABQ9GPV2_9NEOP|nr:hypothetical protein PR048_024867 [Dryococelus australis]
MPNRTHSNYETSDDKFTVSVDLGLNTRLFNNFGEKVCTTKNQLTCEQHLGDSGDIRNSTSDSRLSGSGKDMAMASHNLPGMVLEIGSGEGSTALNEILRGDDGETRSIWSSAEMQGWGKLEIPEKTQQPAASSRTIPKRENPRVTSPGIKPSLPW